MTKLYFIASMVANLTTMRACNTPSASDAGTPGVLCGSTSCDGITQVCCLDSYAAMTACMDVTLWCGTPTSTGAPATCDEPSDCPSGEACCVYFGAGYGSVECRASTECPGESWMINENLLCESPAGSFGCPSGKACVPIGAPFPAGWSRCEL
jgi:hypothetical protein